MANVKITELTELAAVDLADGDVLPIVDVGADTTKKVTIASVRTISDSNDFVTYTQLNANIDVVSGNVDAVEANVASIVDTGGHTVTFSGNVIPSADGVYDLGSASAKWKDLHLTGASIKLGGITISDLGNEGISITGASGEQANVVTPQLGGAANVSANIATLEANVASTDTRLGANITLLTNEDTALQARIAANTLVAASNDFITFTRLQANIDLVQDNVATVSVGTASDTETRLNANLDIVQDNVAAISVTLGIRGDGGTNDDVTVGTEELVFLGDTGITTTVSSNTVTIDLDDTAVSPGLYGGVSGGVTNVAAVTIDATGRITNASNVSVVTNLDTLQDNINVLDGNADAIAADVTALETRRSDNTFFVYNNSIHANVEITAANLLSSANNTFSLGAPDKQWKDVYIGPGSLYVNNKQVIQDDSGTITIKTDVNEDLKIETSGTGSLTLSTGGGTGAIILSGSVGVASGSISIDDPINMNTNRITGLAAPAAGTDAVRQTDLDEVQGNLSSTVTTVDAFGTYANTNFDTKANASSTYTSLNTDITAIETRRVANVAGAISSVLTSDLTISRALASDGSGKIAVSDITSTELGYLDGVTSAIQTQLDAIESRRSANNITTTFSDDVTITGNLTINGATTTVSSTNMLVEDALIELQNGLTGSNSNDVGVIFERGTTGDNGMFFWDESEDEFAFATGTETGASTGSLTIANYADIAVKNITVSGTVDGIDIATNAAALATEDAALETRRASNIAGAVSTITTGNLTASRALASDGSGKVAVSAVTATELGYLDGVTSAIQTQIDSKQATITGAATTIDDTNLTASRAVVSDGSGKIAVSAVTSTELGYLDGVTSAIQTQIDSKQATITGAATTIDDTNLTASRAVVSDGSGKVAVSAVTSTELGYLDGVSSAIQTQLDAKGTTTEDAAIEARRTANIAGAVSTITTSDLTTSRALASDGSGKVAVSAVTATELGYLDGVTSAIQTQLDAKLASASYTASDVLTKLLTVDGTGSSLDADLLDGQHANYYAVETTRASNAAELASGVASAVAGSGITSFSFEDGGAGTSVEMGDGQRVKFNEGGGIDITFTDTSPGSVADPYDLTFTIEASVIAGDGLTGGGVLSADRTLNIGAGTGVTVNANDIAIGQDVGTGDSPTFAGLTVTTFDLGALS